MSYDEEQQKRSRLVVETPHERREVVQHQTVRAPTHDRRGFSGGMLAVVALATIAITSLVFLFIITRGDGDDDASVSVNARTAAQQPTPAVAQQPVMAPSAPLPQPTPYSTTIVVPPGTITGEIPTGSSAPPATSQTNPTADDAVVKRKIERSFTEDPDISEANLTIDVISGKAILTGTVGSKDLSDRAERLARAIAGEGNVVNRIRVETPLP